MFQLAPHPQRIAPVHTTRCSKLENPVIGAVLGATKIQNRNPGNYLKTFLVIGHAFLLYFTLHNSCSDYYDCPLDSSMTKFPFGYTFVSAISLIQWIALLCILRQNIVQPLADIGTTNVRLWQSWKEKLGVDMWLAYLHMFLFTLSIIASIAGENFV